MKKILPFLIIISALFASLIILNTPHNLFSSAKVRKSPVMKKCGYVGGPCCTLGSKLCDESAKCVNFIQDGFNGLWCKTLDDVCGQDLGSPCCANGSCKRQDLICTKYTNESEAQYVTDGKSDLLYPQFATYIPPGQTVKLNQSPGWCNYNSEEQITGAIDQCGSIGQACCTSNPHCYDYYVLCIKNPGTIPHLRHPSCQPSKNNKFQLVFKGLAQYSDRGKIDHNIILNTEKDSINYIRKPSSDYIDQKGFRVFFEIKNSNIAIPLLYENLYFTEQIDLNGRKKQISFFSQNSQILSSNYDIYPSNFAKPLTIDIHAFQSRKYDGELYGPLLVSATIQFYDQAVNSPTPSPKLTNIPALQSTPPPSQPLPGQLNGPCKPPPLRCNSGLVCNNTSKTCVKK